MHLFNLYSYTLRRSARSSSWLCLNTGAHRDTVFTVNPDATWCKVNVSQYHSIKFSNVERGGDGNVCFGVVLGQFVTLVSDFPNTQHCSEQRSNSTQDKCQQIIASGLCAGSEVLPFVG